MFKKKWKCMDCGSEFETDWIPSSFVECPNCGSKNIYRIDRARGKGVGPRHRRRLCKRF